MRDPERIKIFCNELADIWETKCPDWRFGQLVGNVFRASNHDPFFVEEDEMMKMIKEYFHVENRNS